MIERKQNICHKILGEKDMYIMKKGYIIKNACLMDKIMEETLKHENCDM